MFEYESIRQTKTYWYAYNVVYGEIIACIDVKNACKRFLNDLESLSPSSRTKLTLINIESNKKETLEDKVFG